MSQTTDTTPQCFWCAVPMALKTVFGKSVYECPRCKRRVPAENIVPLPEPAANSSTAAA